MDHSDPNKEEFGTGMVWLKNLSLYWEPGPFKGSGGGRDPR
jgi:hypothetical protein